MKKLILITAVLSFVVYAGNSGKPQLVQVQSRAIQMDKASVRNNMAQREIPSPTRHQTVLTKNADGTLSYQCKQKHNHHLEKKVLK